MAPSSRLKRAPVPLILSSFPAPPSHIPSPSTNPPPTGPPSTPLPPLPSAPSRISEHEQLLILTSVANRSRGSGKYSLNASSNRDSTHSSSSTSRSSSNSLTTTPTSPLPFQRMSIPLSDISDSDTEVDKTTTSPGLSSYSPRSHKPNDSISSIDMRDVLGVYDDSPHDRSISHSRPRLQSKAHQNQHLKHKSIADQIDPEFLLSIEDIPPTIPTAASIPPSPAAYSASYTPPHSTSEQDDTNHTKPQEPQSSRVPSPDIATILSVMPRPALSLSRSRSGPHDPNVRSKSRSNSTLPPVQRTVSLSPYPDHLHPFSLNRNRRQSEGAPITTIHKLGHVRSSSSELAYLHKHSDSTVSITPSPLSTVTTTTKKISFSQSATGGCNDQEVEDAYDEALERVLEGRGSEDEDEGVLSTSVVWDSAVRDNPRQRPSRGNTMQEEEIIAQEEGETGDSDSSLDLHTPLPHLMLRHGLLSPNSKLLPQAACSRAATPLDGRPGSKLSLVSNGSKSGIIKDERDTLTRRVRHRDGKLLRGGIGLTTGLGWSDSEDEDAPSPLTRRLSTLDLSRRSSASSIRSSTLPHHPLSASLSSSSLRRLHPLSRSYSSGSILETEREHHTFGSYDSYPYPYDYEEERGEGDDEDEEDHTVEESGQWAQRHRLGVSSPPVSSWPRRRQPPRSRRHHLGARTSTGSVGSGFSLEVTIPEGVGEERSKTPSRLRRPSSHTSIKGAAVAGGGGGRDSSGSSGLSSNHFGRRRSGGEDNNGGGGNGNTPTSTSSTLSIPMPITPKDIFDPDAPPLLSSTRGMTMMNKDKSLPPLPGGLKTKSSGNLRAVISNGTSTTSTSNSTTMGATTLNGNSKYAFPRTRTFSSTSATSTSPVISVTGITTTTAAASSIIPSSSSSATIKPIVRPLQLPRQITRSTVGDRAAVPVPSPILHHSPPLSPPNSLCALTHSLSTLSSSTTTTTTTTSARHPSPILLSSPPLSPKSTTTNALRTPSYSLLTHRPSPITLSHAAAVAPPAPPSASPPSSPGMTTTGILRPKPRTGTGMVYRTSSHGSKLRTPMILSGSSSAESSGGAGAGSGSGSMVERSRAIAL